MARVDPCGLMKQWKFTCQKHHLNKTFAKSNLIDLCTYLNALQGLDILHSCFNTKFLLARMLINCGCLLYYKSMWQQPGMPLEEFTVPIRKSMPASLQTLHKVLVKYPRAADWEEWLSYIAYSFFKKKISSLVWCYHSPGPTSGEHKELTGAVAQKEVDFAPPPKTKCLCGWTALGYLCGAVCWRCLCRKKKAYSINHLKMGSELFTFIDQHFFPSVSQPWSRILQERTGQYISETALVPPPFPCSEGRYWSALSSALLLALTMAFICCNYSSLLTTTGAFCPWQDQELWSHT